MKHENIPNGWRSSTTQEFWGEIAPRDHVVQIYEDNQVFLDTLAGFAGTGFNAGDAVIIIATSAHLSALEYRLKAHGIYLDALIAGDQYIPVDAHEALSKFMVDGRVDEALFMSMADSLVKRARLTNRNIRACGEMVAILWEQGNYKATIQLEETWSKFCEREPICLFCAYPKKIFTTDPGNSIIKICNTHSMIIDSSEKPMTEIRYRNVG